MKGGESEFDGAKSNRPASSGSDLVRKTELDALMATRPTNTQVVDQLSTVGGISQTTDTQTFSFTFSGGNLSGSVRYGTGLAVDAGGLKVDFAQVATAAHTHSQLHDPVTAVDSVTVAFGLTGQQITASVKLKASNSGLEASAGLAVDWSAVSSISHSHPLVTDAANGFMSPEMKTKLDAMSNYSLLADNTNTINLTLSVGPAGVGKVLTGEVRLGYGLTSDTDGVKVDSDLIQLKGDSRYTYVAYADEVIQGMPIGYSTTPSATKKWIAVLSSTVSKEAPNTSIFIINGNTFLPDGSDLTHWTCQGDGSLILTFSGFWTLQDQGFGDLWTNPGTGPIPPLTGWVTTGLGFPSNPVGTYGGGLQQSDFDGLWVELDSRGLILNEDFIGGITWVTGNIAGTGVFASDNGEVSAGKFRLGVLSVTTGSTSGNASYLRSNPGLPLTNLADFKWTAFVAFKIYNIGNIRFRVGFVGDATVSPTNGYFCRFDTVDGDGTTGKFRFVCKNTVETVSPSSVSADTAWHTLTMRSDGSSTFFSLDGEAEVAIANNRSNVPMVPALHIATAIAATTKKASLDWFAFSTRGVSR